MKQPRLPAQFETGEATATNQRLKNESVDEVILQDKVWLSQPKIYHKQNMLKTKNEAVRRQLLQSCSKGHETND